MNPQNNQLPAINGTQPTHMPADSGQGMPTAPQQAPPIPQVSQASSTSQPPISSMASTPAIADDTDLIEKEWVLKAKQIVEQTKDDPYTQNQEMNRMKADYIKKRYNKDVKIEES